MLFTLAVLQSHLNIYIGHNVLDTFIDYDERPTQKQYPYDYA